jgi:hypothetical protein
MKKDGKTMETYEIINVIVGIASAFFFLITAVGAIIAVFQLREMKRQAKQKTTVNIMIKWCNAISKETSFAENIVENFTKSQCEALYNREPFDVDIETKEKLCVTLCPNHGKEHDCKKCKETKSLEVSDLLLQELRWHIICYLNALETVMIAWKHKSVYDETILEQFSSFYDPSRKRNILEEFRKVAGGGKSYPVINSFCDDLKAKYEKENPNALGKTTRGN